MKNTVELLLVDDDEIDREAVRRLLGPHYTVHEAATGGDALELASSTAVDCVLLDYRLPDIDGLQLLPRFSEALRPVVMLTGEESPEVIVEAMREGAQDYLVKGNLSGASLDHAISNAIEKVALKQALAEKRDQLAEQAQALERKNLQLRGLASALVHAEQQERRRIAEVLHDHLQQYLHGAKLRSRFLRKSMPGDAAGDLLPHVDQIDEILDQAINTTRTLSVELSPPVLRTEGLGAALRWLAQHMKTMHDMQVDVAIEDERPVPGEDMRVFLYHLVQELLFNVVKHAGVDRASVRFEVRDGEYVVHVADEGAGFDVDDVLTRPAQHRSATEGGLGLFNVRERLELFGGRLDIDSRVGCGTHVCIVVPLEEPTAAAAM